MLRHKLLQWYWIILNLLTLLIFVSKNLLIISEIGLIRIAKKRLLWIRQISVTTSVKINWFNSEEIFIPLMNQWKLSDSTVKNTFFSINCNTFLLFLQCNIILFSSIRICIKFICMNPFISFPQSVFIWLSSILLFISKFIHCEIILPKIYLW